MNRKELIAALKLALPGVETGTILMEGADLFSFTDAAIVTDNGRVSVSVPFKTGVTGAIKAAEALKILERIKEDEVELVVEENQLKFRTKSGLTELDMMTSERAFSIKVPDDVEWEPIADNFIAGLKLCAVSLTDNPSLGILCGICVSGVDMVTTDNLRASFFELSSPMRPCIISYEAVQFLSKFSALQQYAIRDPFIHFQSDSGAVFSCYSMEGEYLLEKLKALFQFSPDSALYKLPKDKLLESVERTEVLSYASDFSEYITLTKQNEFLVVKGAREFGTITDKVPLSDGCSFPDDVVLNISPKFLKDILKLTDSFYFEKDKVMFKAPNFSHLMMTC